MAEEEKKQRDAAPARADKPGAGPGEPRDARSGEGQPERKPPVNRKKALIIGGAIAGVLLVVAFLWWLHARNYESTDDAFIDAHVVRVAPRIAGQVARVLVHDNQSVDAGEVLVEIERADPQSRLEQISSQGVEAQTQLEQARAQLPVSEAAYEQALANASAARAQSAKAQRDVKRYQALHQENPKAVSRTQLDQIVTTADDVRAQLEVAEEQVRSAAAQREVARVQVTGAQARERTLQAQIGEAQLNLGYTRIVAPFAGHVTQKSVTVGSYLAVGQQLMAIVPLDLWVTANFKETQLALMRPRQHVEISVDACPKVTLPGHVDSIQRGAGQAFALLPPENATGNYVKVVQRVPVKIILERVPRDCPLGPGMSVEPTVQVR
jgi:membrane fusion protein, multidrug efflux system